MLKNEGYCESILQRGQSELGNWGWGGHWGKQISLESARRP